MWEIYDALIENIPEGLHVKRVVAGSFWTAIESELGTGIAGSPCTLTRPNIYRDSLIGMKLRDAAALSKSWNMVEASIGVAAMNAYYNTPEVSTQNGVILPKCAEDDRINDPYIFYQNMVLGKKVAGIGSSDMLETLMGDKCTLSIIGNETPGSYPMSAVDYLLPHQDFVYLPCSSITTKALPRLLALASNAKVIICGPSIPLSPILHSFGADDLAGFVVTDGDLAFNAATGLGLKSMFGAGKKVNFKA